MVHHREALVAFDTAKLRNAVAVADASRAAYPVDSGSSICSVLSDRPRSVAGTYTDGQGALAF